MRVRISAGTAVVLGLRAGGGEVPPTTAYLMLGESCPRNCAFCAQARDSTAGAGRLSRVTWPSFELGDVLEALGRACRGGSFQRVCVQTLAGPSSGEGLLNLLAGLRPAACGTPLSASVYARDLAQLDSLFNAGLDRAGLALDAASAETYREVKGGSMEDAKAFLEAAARRFPGKISTHLIAGLGETEAELLREVQWCADRGITVGLFAFTPVRGTRLASRRPPGMTSYRKVQAAAYLIGRRDVRFPELGFLEGRLVHLGLEPARAADILAGGDAFRTAGCGGCNRPYYNERPGRVPYNYPRPLTPVEARDAVALVLPATGGGNPA